MQPAISDVADSSSPLLPTPPVFTTATFLHTPRTGAETSVYLAAFPEVEGVSGKYFVDCREPRSSRESYDEAAAQRLWKVSARMAGAGA
jgi:hypothetical protein